MKRDITHQQLEVMFDSLMRSCVENKLQLQYSFRVFERIASHQYVKLTDERIALFVKCCLINNKPNIAKSLLNTILFDQLETNEWNPSLRKSNTLIASFLEVLH
ncbi:hypothetical protein AKO1_015636 [Acrasis kona]|uniref:Uncharacterized protein n=1 Tax=Acrasis kona TaxID=1008807 RepID=A0AAW2ZG86_9EUKA